MRKRRRRWIRWCSNTSRHSIPTGSWTRSSASRCTPAVEDRWSPCSTRRAASAPLTPGCCATAIPETCRETTRPWSGTWLRLSGEDTLDVLLDAEREKLLRLARRSLEARVRGQTAPDVEHGGVFDDLFGAFVTIHRHGELRGCLGRIEGDAPL